MNQADREFVEGLEIVLGDSFYEDFSHVYVRQCLDIIRKQEKALEKCKEQRDEYIKERSDYFTDTEEWCKAIDNKELEQILAGGS